MPTTPRGLHKNLVALPHAITESPLERVQRATTSGDCVHCITIQAVSPQLPNPEPAAAQVLRLVVLDLALRLSAILRFSGRNPPKDPTWAEANGAGKMLRQLLTEAGLTREELAYRAGFSDNTVDIWLDGKARPQANHIGKLADQLAPQLGADPASLCLRIRRQYILASIANTLAQKGLGRRSVIELAKMLYQFTRFIMDDIRACSTWSPENDLMLLGYGTECGQSRFLLDHLWFYMKLAGGSPEWCRDIQAAATDWTRRFQEIAKEYGPSGTEDEADADLERLFLARRTDDSYYIRARRPTRAEYLQSMGDDLTRHRGVVERNPLNPKAHLELGSLLGQVGRDLKLRKLIDEGITECRIAAALKQGWDAPLVEPGVILVRAGCYEEGAVELEAAASRLPKTTRDLGLHLGLAYMMLARFQEALQSFQAVLEENPGDVIALAGASCCALRCGDRRLCARYAKAARIRGEHFPYSNWRGKVHPKGKKAPQAGDVGKKELS